jgi:hypothetical protein
MLEFSEQLAGLSRTCPDCGETSVLPESAILERSQIPLGPPRRRPDVLGPPRSQPASPELRWLKRYGWVVIVPAVAVVIVAGVLYDVLHPDVWIYVDNGGTQPLEVTIDASQRTTVAPGNFALVKCHSGERRLQVNQGETHIFDEVKQLEPGGVNGVTKYLLNPGLTRRYRTRVVEYSVVAFHVPSLDLDRAFFVVPGYVQSKYDELARKPALLNAVPWQEISGCDYVLELEPNKIEGTIHEKRTVLGRVDKDDYAFIQEARRKANPTVEDLDALAEVVSRVLQSIP